MNNENKIEAASKMFSHCPSLLRIDFSHFDLSQVKDLEELLLMCQFLISVDFTNCDTSNVESLAMTFFGCNSLKEVKMNSSFKTENVNATTMAFHGCESIIELNLEHWDLRNVNRSYWMFNSCCNLEKLEISEKFTFKHEAEQFIRCDKLDPQLIKRIMHGNE